jgi:hypothetical protein
MLPLYGLTVTPSPGIFEQRPDYHVARLCVLSPDDEACISSTACSTYKST